MPFGSSIGTVLQSKPTGHCRRKSAGPDSSLQVHFCCSGGSKAASAHTCSRRSRESPSPSVHAFPLVCSSYATEPTKSVRPFQGRNFLLRELHGHSACSMATLHRPMWGPVVRGTSTRLYLAQRTLNMPNAPRQPACLLLFRCVHFTAVGVAALAGLHRASHSVGRGNFSLVQLGQP